MDKEEEENRLSSPFLANASFTFASFTFGAAPTVLSATVT
jgi:hypothetical protein